MTPFRTSQGRLRTSFPLLILGLAAAPAALPQTTSGGIPAPPPVPARIPFADELAGWRLLQAARDAYANAPALRFSARWTLRSQRGARTDTTSGVETIAAEPKARRLALTTETTTPGGKEIRRVITSGGELLATRYRARTGEKTPTREFVRFSLDPGATLADALRQAQVAPRTGGGQFVSSGRVRGTTWRAAAQTVNGRPADAVWEIEPAQDLRYDDTGARFTVTTKSRLLLDSKTHLLLRLERWVNREARNGPARDPRNGYFPATYQREDYDAAQAVSAPLPAALFALAAPPGYRETVLPDAPATEPRGPKEADPEARRLLAKWARAQERLLTYSAQFEMIERQEQNPDPAARPLRNRNENRLLYTVWLHKPGRARLTEETPGPAGTAPARQRRQQARSLLAVSDGARLSLFDRERSRLRTRTLDDPADLADELNNAGFDTGVDLLRWLLEAPDLRADRAVSRGRQALENETVDVVDLITTQVARPQGGQQPVEVTRTTTLYLGTDGLPRRIDERRERNVIGTLARDQPGAQVTSVRYRQTRVDEAPPPGTFAFEPPRR